VTGPARRTWMHGAHPHDSARRHVTGSARFTDDVPLPPETLHAYLGLSTIARARLERLELEAVRSAPGVVGVLTAQDIPGTNDISASRAGDDPVLAEGEIVFWGQPLFIVVADTRDAARRAARLARVDGIPLAPVLELAQADETVVPPLTLTRGDAAAALPQAAHRITGTMNIGGQEHFYLEGQIAVALPGEDDEMHVISSTQHPGEVQHMVAHVLDVPASSVTVTVRRLGGGFGGKESQSSLFAAAAALAARRFNRPVKLRPDRDDDMTATGKRHDFEVDYDVGFDDTGRILAVEARLASRAGFSADLSGPIADRALFQADNAYYYPNVRLTSRPLRTNTVSNTAFRGFGGPQGLLVAERMIEEIACRLGRTPLEIRKANLYASPGRDLTPYWQRVSDNLLPRLFEELETACDFHARHDAVRAFNTQGGVIRKGIALTPVKFGISFTLTWLNQAGALVHVYQDGSIHLNHGGTEMGQGLLTKVALVVADCFQVDLDRIRITETSTATVPNASATAASTGSDLNGMAAFDAAEKIRRRLVDFAAERWSVEPDRISFENNRVRIGNREMAFGELIAEAYRARVQLSATGFYKTPDIHWDRETGRGEPFYYFVYGTAASEVTVDTLTGEYRVDRVDILQDIGRSLDPAIDVGQIEGGFIQGMGWVTTEELWWDETGRLCTHAPSTYKIPLASDCPAEFNVHIAPWSENVRPTIGRSKAVGEPPLLLCASVVEALSMAVASVDGYRTCPRLDVPVTPERVLQAVHRLRAAGSVA